MKEPTTAFGVRRLELGLTQQSLADQCRALGQTVGDSQISKIERGVSTPRPPLRKTLRKILGADPVELAKRPAADHTARRGVQRVRAAE